MLNLTQRNLIIFFRQKSAVFFSLLGIIIILGLYIVFLGNVWTENYNSLPDVDTLMHNWITAGIVSVASITTTMGAFGIMVEDRARKNSKDFFSSPLKRNKIVGGYTLSAYTVGVILSIITFILGELYIAATGGDLLTPQNMLKMLGVILLSALMSSSLIFFIVSFFHSTSAFTSASTILGTLIGFLTGIYLPIGTLPENVQWIIKLFPLSHASALMRQIMLKDTMQSSFSAIPDNYLTEFKEKTGVILTFGDYTASPLTHILVLITTTILFYFLALWNVSKKKK